MAGLNRIPDRVPVGTKFVVEGHRDGSGRAQVFSRYLEYPDGQKVRLADAVARPNRRRTRPKAH